MVKNIDWIYLIGKFCPSMSTSMSLSVDTDRDRDMDMDIFSAIVVSKISLNRSVQISSTNVEISLKFTYMNINFLTLNCVYAFGLF
jgi:hypothetical protein